MTTKKLQVEDIIALSPVQRAILREITSGSGQPPSGQKAYRICGALDRALLQEAWNGLVACSSALRSSIHSEGMEKPVRVVRREQQAVLAWSDWKHVPTAGQTGRILQELRAEERESSGAENASAVHAMVAELASDEYLLICRINRLLLDECSMDILVQQLFHCYGQAIVPSRPDNFKIYLDWVNTNASAAEKFWHDYLRGVRDTSITGELPGGTGDEEGCTMAHLPAEAALRFFEEHGEAAFRALLCGAWALLLRSHLGREEAIFRIATNGREVGFCEVDQVIGPLAVVFPFRATLPAQSSIAEWLSVLEKQMNEAACHAHVMPEYAEPERSLFDTIVQFLPRPLEFTAQTAAGPFSVQEITLPLPARYPLNLNVRFDRGIVLEMNSNGHFEPESVERLMSHFIGMLEALSAAPSQPCAAIQAMPKEEVDRLLQLSDGGIVSPLPETIHAGFEAQVRQTPENLAAISESGSYTYGELNRRANQLAARLRSSGVGPEAVVGVFMERCLEILTAVLAISKAGGIYLPLAPDLPQERISFLLRDAKSAVLLTRQDLIGDLPLAAATAEIITLDEEWESFNGFSAENVESGVVPGSGAYIIYTSGSTGEPKGVIVSQAAAVHHLFAAARAFGYSPTDRTLQFAALSFDVSIEQLLAPLMCGASVMLKDGASWSRLDFFDAARKFEITVANVPPAFWTQLVEEEELPAGLPLRLMIVGGDTMLPAALAQWRQGPMQSIELLNAYGPTEAVITSNLFRISPIDDKDFPRVPIGRPLAGRKAYVILHGEQMPIQMWGELHLGGPVLARGYLNRPELTAEKFIPDPWSKEPGARLYKTGDIARYRGDGQIEFLGRIDHQVKIRGFRIELGEIEHVLAQHPAVLHAVATVREAQEGDKRLVAYVVSRAATPAASELRDFLKSRLPEYMVPSAIDFLSTLPLTPAGKVDRRALPAMGETTVAAATPPADATPAERALMEVWSELLGVSEMSAHDNFFDLGGDSLLATQIISRVKKAFGVEIPLRVIFDSPTIAAMVGEIEERGGVPVREAEPEMTRVSDDQELMLSPAQARLWFVCREMGQSSMYNMTGAVEFEGDLDLELLEETLAILVRRHEALRTVFPLRDDHPVQVVLSGFPVKLPVTDLSHLPETLKEGELCRLLEQESEFPFDLLQGPVFRSRILRLSSRRHVLLSTIHHIAGDGWSLGILAREISVVYGALLRGEGSPLPDMPFRYIDFAHWQQRLLERRRESHVDFWTNRLSGCPPPSPLPQEKLPDQNGTMHGANYSIQFSRETFDNLAKSARDQNATLFMVLLACWKALLSFYTGSDDIVVGTDIANRRAETEKIIGLFVNVLVLRTDLGGNPAFSELLERVRETTLAAYQHQDFPFNQVLETLNPEWRDGQRALFKTFFHFLIGRLEVPKVPGLQIAMREPDDRVAKFDLSVRVTENSEGVVCRFNYATRLFEEGVIRQIAQDYQCIVERVAENPFTRLNILKTMVETQEPDVPSFESFMTTDSRS